MDIDTGFIGRFIFLVTFLGVFIIIVGFMVTESPALFFGATTDYLSPLPPDYLTDVLTADELRTLAFWGNISITRGGQETLTIERSAPMDDINIEINWMTPQQNTENFIMNKYWYDWGFWRKNIRVLPKYPKNPYFSPPHLCEDDFFHADNLDDSGDFSKVQMEDDAYNYVCFTTYDNASYSSLLEAFTDGSLILSLGMGIEYESAMISGWDIIARLIVFQAPDTHPLVNSIIAIPLISSVSVIIFLISLAIVKALPFT